VSKRIVLICAKLRELISSISPRGLIRLSTSLDKNDITGKIISPYNLLQPLYQVLIKQNLVEAVKGWCCCHKQTCSGLKFYKIPSAYFFIHIMHP